MVTKEFTITKTYEITDKEIEDIRDNVFSWMGLRATKAQVIVFLNTIDKPAVFENIKEEIDTVTREMIMDEFAMKLIGKEWPIGADSKEIQNQFEKEFNAAAKTAGYKLDN